MKPRDKYRLEGFTLLEITIALLISSVVLGVAYSAYRIVSRSYTHFHQRSETLAEIARMDQWMKRDFFSSDSIRLDSGQLKFTLKGRTYSSWLFSQSAWIRKSANPDTLSIPISRWSFSFDGKEIMGSPTANSGDVNGLAASSPRVDGFTLDLIMEGDTLPFGYYKPYSSENLFPKIAHAQH